MNAIPQGNSGSRTTVGMRFDKGMSTNFLVPSKFNELNRAKSNEFHAQINSAKSVMAQERAWGTRWRPRTYRSCLAGSRTPSNPRIGGRAEGWTRALLRNRITNN